MALRNNANNNLSPEANIAEMNSAIYRNKPIPQNTSAI